jgi:hypothetical protein
MVHRKLATWLQLLSSKGRMTMSSCPQGLRQDIERLIDRKILKTANDKKRLFIEVQQIDEVTHIIESNLIAAPDDTPNRAVAIMEHGDSKSGEMLDAFVLNFRSAHEGPLLRKGGDQFDVYAMTSLGTCLGLVLSHKQPESLSYDGKLYLIENMECWAHAETYLPHDGLYLRYDGWISERMMVWLENQNFTEIVISPDYDLVGLQNWMLLKQRFPNSTLHFPDNFDELIIKYQAPHLWKKQQGYLEKTSQLIDLFDDNITLNWFMAMQLNGCCLEQEALLIKKVAI